MCLSWHYRFTKIPSLPCILTKHPRKSVSVGHRPGRLPNCGTVLLHIANANLMKLLKRTYTFLLIEVMSFATSKKLTHPLTICAARRHLIFNVGNSDRGNQTPNRLIKQDSLTGGRPDSCQKDAPPAPSEFHTADVLQIASASQTVSYHALLGPNALLRMVSGNHCPEQANILKPTQVYLDRKQLHALFGVFTSEAAYISSALCICFGSWVGM